MLVIGCFCWNVSDVASGEQTDWQKNFFPIVKILNGRFHSLPEFHGNQRICLKQLADQNGRRRKPHQEMLHFNWSSMSSWYYGIHQNSHLLVEVDQTVGGRSDADGYTGRSSSTHYSPWESGGVYGKPAYKRENGASSYTVSATQAPRLAPCTANWNPPTYRFSHVRTTLSI